MIKRYIWQEFVDRAEQIRKALEGYPLYKQRKGGNRAGVTDAKEEKYGMSHTMLKEPDWERNWLRLKFAAMNLKSDTQRAM